MIGMIGASGGASGGVSGGVSGVDTAGGMTSLQVQGKITANAEALMFVADAVITCS